MIPFIKVAKAEGGAVRVPVLPVRLPSLALRLSERRYLLVVTDSLLLCLALGLSVLLRTELLNSLDALLFNIKWFVTLILVWAIVATIFDAYDLARSADLATGMWNVATAAVITSAVYQMIPWLTPPIENRSQGYLFVVLAVTMVPLWRLLYAALFGQAVFQRRALVVGAGRSARALMQALRYEDDLGRPAAVMGHLVVGFVDDDPLRHGSQVLGVPVLGDSGRLLELAGALKVDEIVVAISNLQAARPALLEAILDCREQGIPVMSMTTLYERLTGRVAFEFGLNNVELASGQDESPWARMYVFLKRLVDIGGGIAALVPLALLIPLVTLGNALTSPGPLFFRQRRVGRGGRNFTVIKFRSMVADAEHHSGAVWAQPEDERVTPLGRLLRLTHLDELPQAINVLRGEMSLVGPRPERPEFVALLSESIPFYRARHSLRPGISGWAQIHQNYGDSVERASEKLQYDLYYIKHAGPALDSLIVLRTISKVLTLQGR